MSAVARSSRDSFRLNMDALATASLDFWYFSSAATSVAWYSSLLLPGKLLSFSFSTSASRSSALMEFCCSSAVDI